MRSGLVSGMGAWRWRGSAISEGCFGGGGGAGLFSCGIVLVVLWLWAGGDDIVGGAAGVQRIVGGKTVLGHELVKLLRVIEGAREIVFGEDALVAGERGSLLGEAQGGLASRVLGVVGDIDVVLVLRTGRKLGTGRHEGPGAKWRVDFEGLELGHVRGSVRKPGGLSN